MDKNNTSESYNKLLKSYLGLTGFLIGVNQADAQVLYHNIIPDTLLVAPSNCLSTYLDLDLNNDGTMDFRFGAKKCLPSFYSYYSTNPPPYTYYGCRSERAWMKEGVSNKMIPDYYTCIANNST